jgi:hypothetical protein
MIYPYSYFACLKTEIKKAIGASMSSLPIRCSAALLLNIRKLYKYQQRKLYNGLCNLHYAISILDYYIIGCMKPHAENALNTFMQKLT